MTKSKSRPVIVSLTIAAILLASGCGGASKSKPLSRAELTAKADAICRRVIPEVNWEHVKPEELPRVVNRLAKLEEQAADELGALTPPPAMADEWRLIVDAFHLTGPEFRKIAADVQTAPSAYPTLPLSNAQHERALQANVEGIKDCAKY
ncbi:MAG: hypothetical protein ACTHM1_00365 [Solirubrobacteraceae bacterium]